LGIDLVPFKTCTYDCIYCQLGRTTKKTTTPKVYIPNEEVLLALAEKLRVEPKPDYIGLAGSGEPTLHAGMGDLIAGIKACTDIPVAVITNGSLLWRPEIRASLAEADLVLPSLDAGSRLTFERVNRPHPDLSFEEMTDGLLTFSHEFKGTIWLEVFLLSGINDQREEVARIATLTKGMRLDRVQLNTVSRPPAESEAHRVTPEELETVRGLFSRPCEIIAERRSQQPFRSTLSDHVTEAILALLSRRPCTLEGISEGLALPPNEVIKQVETLLDQGLLRSVRRDELVFYERSRSPKREQHSDLPGATRALD